MFLTYSIHFQQVNVFFLFEVIFLLRLNSLALLRLNSLASKSVLDIKFTCANLALKTAANLFNSEISIYL